jgi:nucleotide-binding universal stress UspA family protein
MTAAGGQPAPTTLGVAPAAARGPVVVGVEASSGSLAALEWAAAEAADRQVPLHIVHTWSWQHLAPWSTAADRMVISDLKRAGDTLVSRCRSLAQEHEGLEVTAEVREGSAAHVLTELSHEAGLLVVGTHHLRPVGRAVLGSASSAVVTHAACPTVVVSAPPEPATGRPTLILGVAATPEDQQVIAFALAHARRHALPVRALYCWHPDALADNQLPPPDRAVAWLAEALAGWREEYPDVEISAAVVRRHPVAGLVEHATEKDLIVIGRRAHRSRLAGHIGSVSLGVLHHAVSSIAVVPTQPTATQPL